MNLQSEEPAEQPEHGTLDRRWAQRSLYKLWLQQGQFHAIDTSLCILYAIRLDYRKCAGIICVYVTMLIPVMSRVICSSTIRNAGSIKSSWKRVAIVIGFLSENVCHRYRLALCYVSIFYLWYSLFQRSIK